MKEEIFGPVLPIKPYRKPEEVIVYVNGHDRPLAFYPFTNDKRLAERYITQVISGSVGVNEAIRQVGEHDLPFFTSQRHRFALAHQNFNLPQLPNDLLRQWTNPDTTPCPRNQTHSWCRW
jgi:acyl-CoA reductase-like NAD-dependent aldehyde dehydrogenase